MIPVEVYPTVDALPRDDVRPMRSQLPAVPTATTTLCDRDGGVFTLLRTEMTLGDPVVALVVDVKGWTTEQLIEVGFEKAEG